MKKLLKYLTVTIITLLLQSKPGFAQEEASLVYQSAKKYIEFNVKKQEKFNSRVEKQQRRLLQRLKRKEHRYAARLKSEDPVAFAGYQEQQPSFDSISRIKKANAPPANRNPLTKSTASIDSLKTIQSFIADKIHLQGGTDNAALNYDDKLNTLKADQNYNDYISGLISKRTNNLKNINSSTKGKVAGFKGIDKQTYYARERIKALKNINDEPNKAEELARETLQGQEGFTEYMQNSDPHSMEALAAKGATASDLEKMGFQTKRQLNEQLQKKFNGNLSPIQQRMGGQIKDYQKKINKLKTAQQTINEGKNSVRQLTNMNTPSFKVNPMRGLPVRKRIEKQVNWQTTRATIDGKPAIFQVAAMAGFRHNARLAYGLGIATSIGLGHGWDNIHISFQGIGLRTYANWQLIYGIGAYAGYERMFKQAAFVTEKVVQNDANNNNHDNQSYNESVLVGLTKNYRVSGKWNGSMQVLYDIWWKEKGLRSPIVLRIATTTK